MQKAQADARAALVAQYVFLAARDSNPNGAPVLLVIDTQRREDSVMTGKVADLCSAAGITTRTSIFTPSFIASSLFGQILGGQVTKNADFQPEKYATRIFAIQVAVKISQQEPVANVPMLAADVTMTVQLLDVATGRVEQSAKINARGAGFKEVDAREIAFEHALNQLVRELPRFKITPQ
jgi:hypothetical protein